ncbi:MAG: hypothetical protein M0P47_07950 [Bacteroidales bacterium]|nr:hypothetical protein [Bacteroidales bacterium]
MNITRENTGELTATLKIEIVPADYTKAVEKQINDYKKKANLPGFRPGHIPVGLIKKMYGKAVLADEVNKLLSDSLMNYIKDEKIDILGNPLPNIEKDVEVDFDNQTSFTFYFDLGIAPEFSIPFDQNLHVDKYLIQVDNEMINKYVENTRKQFGKPLVSDVSSEEKISEQPDVKKDEPKKEPEVELAEMNAEFFDKVYPGMKIETEEDFRNQVKIDASTSFSSETDKLFFNQATDALVKSTNITMPDSFLKRWLLENNEGKYSPEEIEKNYSSFAESMKWQLIENKIIKENSISITDEDIRQYIRTYLLRQVLTSEIDPEMQKRYDSIVDAFMQNKEQVQRINDQLYNAKMLELFKEKLNIDTKEVSYDEFIKIASSIHTHDHENELGHDHDHEHDHEHEDNKSNQ